MSLLDKRPLQSWSAPKTYGDQLPGRFPEYKDGVEEAWSRREAKAIRGLAAGYSRQRVAKECHVTLRKLEGWMGNPYFMMEVQRLTDHNVFRFRPKVLETVAMRAIAGSPQHARLYLMVTRDLREDTFGPNREAQKDPLSELSAQELDARLAEEIKRMK